MKNAYLNAKLTEMIYMRQPLGFATPGDERQVYCLLKALYGLKQAGHCWYQRICEVFAKFLYTHCTMEHCVFHKCMNGEIIIIVITVDDLTLTSSNKYLLDTCKDELQSKFNIMDLGPIHWLLGVEVKRDWYHASI